jgi:hypothetical protein
MQFLILNYVKPRGFMETMPENDPDGPAWGAYTQALIEAGVMRGGAALKPSQTATTLRIVAASASCTTGPMPTPRSSSAASS